MTSDEIEERLLICEMPYTDELEISYRDFENQKYITLRYDKRKLCEWGKELSKFNIINDFRNLLIESENNNE